MNNTDHSYSFTAMAEDTLGNSSTQSITITILDSNISHDNFEYEEVVSLYTQKVWLDRNIGASQVCTARNDTACYGDYYQWGRNSDGHEKSTSGLTSTQATDVNNTGHGKFIKSTDAYDKDWAQTADSNGSIRATNWSKTDGSSVCPTGYRVPTMDEIKSERTGGVYIEDYIQVYNSFLKLPSAGYHDIIHGNMSEVGAMAILWSSTPEGSNSYYIYFIDGSFSVQNSYRAYGLSIRCLKD